MRDFIIMTDSSCDLPAELAAELDLAVQPLTVNLAGREYHNYLDWPEISAADFYQRLREQAEAFTSAVNTDAMAIHMEKYLSQGLDVLYIGFSSALSCTYNNADQAAAQLRPRYPEQNIFCLDSKCASLGQGLLIYLTVRYKRDGHDFAETCEFASRTAPRVSHWFTVDDLHYLKRGGRVSATAATLGTVLRIKPVMHMDDEGRLTPVDKVRGRRASIREMLLRMEQTAVDPASQTVMISHGDCLADAEYLADMIREKLSPQDIIINYVGPVIGAHSGPGTLALFFLGSVR